MTGRAELAAFLRARREALRPEDVGLGRGPRRRAEGLRREEVAALSHMSADYYTRIEQNRGPQPSPAMLAAIAQGLHLSLDERDHVFRLAGHRAPERGPSGGHISPGLLRIFDRLHDTPAEIVSELGETLRQTPLGVALSGPLTDFQGEQRSIGFRWFTDPGARLRYAPEDRDALGRVFVANLRRVAGLRGPASRAAHYAEALQERSAEFRALWDEGQVATPPDAVKRFLHPEVGLIELTCQRLIDPDQSHALLVYTAAPGSESQDKLDLLAVIAAAGV